MPQPVMSGTTRSCLHCSAKVVAAVVLCFAAQAALAAPRVQSGCDILLAGNDIGSRINNQLAGSLIASNQLVLDGTRFAGFCGSIGIIDSLAGSHFGNYLSAAVALSTGDAASAVSSNTQAASKSTGMSAPSDSAVLQFASSSQPLADILTLDVNIRLGPAVTVPQLLTMDYVWATAEFSKAYVDLTVVFLRECLDASCYSFKGPSMVLSSLDGLQGPTLTLGGLRQHKAANVLLHNSYAAYPTPYDSFTSHLATRSVILLPGRTYRLTSAVADAVDSSLDTMLLLGSMRLDDVAPPPPQSPPPPQPPLSPPAGQAAVDSSPPPCTAGSAVNAVGCGTLEEAGHVKKQSNHTAVLVGTVVGVLGALVLLALLLAVWVQWQQHRRAPQLPVWEVSALPADIGMSSSQQGEDALRVVSSAEAAGKPTEREQWDVPAVYVLSDSTRGNSHTTHRAMSTHSSEHTDRLDLQGILHAELNESRADSHENYLPMPPAEMHETYLARNSHEDRPVIPCAGSDDNYLVIPPAASAAEPQPHQ